METISKNPAKQLQNVFDAAREKTEQVSSDVSRKASEMASEAKESSSKWAQKAGTWWQQNYGRALGAVGVVAAIGVAGYFIGRSWQRESDQF